MTPLERAARALSDHFGCEWETMRDADRATITGYARAVLMAVRELDEAMSIAGYVELSNNPTHADFDCAWRASVDAILADGGE